jgi:hypothetical protein
VLHKEKANENMKTRITDKGGNNPGISSTFTDACRECYQKVVEQIRTAKDAILAESRELLGVQEQVLKLALNEAEALAWQTLYPHLVFPELATEKVQAVAGWNRRQRAVRQTDSF